MRSKAESLMQSPCLTNRIAICRWSKGSHRVRLEESEKAEKEGREVLRGAKQLPSKNRKNGTVEHGLHLEGLLEWNRNLHVA